jgi:hypothetical protein
VEVAHAAAEAPNEVFRPLVPPRERPEQRRDLLALGLEVMESLR